MAININNLLLALLALVLIFCFTLMLLDNYKNYESFDPVIDAIQSQFPQQSFHKELTDTHPEDWADDGFNLAKNFVYSTSENQVLSASYIKHGQFIIKRQIALAGYRLAEMLNKTLG